MSEAVGSGGKRTGDAGVHVGAVAWIAAQSGIHGQVTYDVGQVVPVYKHLAEVEEEEQHPLRTRRTSEEEEKLMLRRRRWRWRRRRRDKCGEAEGPMLRSEIRVEEEEEETG